MTHPGLTGYDVTTGPLVDTGLAKVASVTGGLRQKNPPEAGRYDLIPAGCWLRIELARALPIDEGFKSLLAYLQGARNGELDEFLASVVAMIGPLEAMRRLAVHYANGAMKYADRNWENGLETGRIVDSLIRHYIKWRCGLTDEDHFSAVLWNGIALMWHEERLRLGQLPRELDTYGIAA